MIARTLSHASKNRIHDRRRLAVFPLVLAVMLIVAFQQTSSLLAAPNTFVLLDTACQQLTTDLRKQVSTPTTTTAERLRGTCQVLGKSLKCSYSGVDVDTRIGGASSSEQRYDIFVNDDTSLAATSQGLLGSEQIIILKKDRRYVATGTYFQGLPKGVATQKQCVGTLEMP